MNILTTDVLVIGGGAAGLRAAIAAREAGANVLLASKTMVGYANNTAIANGRIAAVVDPQDSAECHAADTVEAGRYLNDPRLARLLAEQSPRRVAELDRLGAPLQRSGDGFVVGRSPGHSYARVLGLADGMGYTMSRAFRDFALQIGVRFGEGLILTRALEAEGRIAAAVGIDKRGEPIAVRARAVVLAGGGGGQAFARTNNTVAMTGDGYAFAYRSGLPLRDMEFVQFYPTVLCETGLPTATVYYERLLVQEGGRLRNAQGENVLSRHGLHDAKAATRDALARAMAIEIAEGRGRNGGLVFDLTQVPAKTVQANLRALAPALRGKGTYLVAPAVHFFMGGVEIDEDCSTAMDGLFAAGEVTGGLHGANRLASNALAETLVFGALAGENAAQFALGRAAPILPDATLEVEAKCLRTAQAPGNDEEMATARQEWREALWQAAGPVRSQQGLERGMTALEATRQRLARGQDRGTASPWQGIELDNMLIVGEMVLRTALLRKESRGAHYRVDFPVEQAEWTRSTYCQLKEGRMTVGVR